MKTSKGFLAVLAAGAVLVCGGVYFVEAHRGSGRRYEAVKQGMEELPQVGARKVPRVPPPRLVRTVEEAGGTEGTPNSGQGGPRSEEPEPSEIALIHLEEARELKRILAEESKDPNWSADTEKRIAVAFSRKLPEGSLIRNVECGSSICLIDLQQKTAAEFEQFVRNTLRKAASSGDDARFWGLATAFITNRSNSGEVSAVVALGREGHDFPRRTE